MLPLKEILILASVLLTSLIIVFISPDTPNNNNKNIQDTTGTARDFLVFKNEIVAPLINPLNSAQQTVFDENQIIKYIPAPADKNENLSKSNTDSDNTIIPLSLETILFEVENLSSDLKLEFENIQKQKENCPTCGQTEQYSPSVCATILMSPGGVGCTCAPPCCYPPPIGCICAHPCCCVCCPPCCL